MSRLPLAVLLTALAVGCAPRETDDPPAPDPTEAPVAAEPTPPVEPTIAADPDAPKKKTIVPPVAAEPAPPASPRLDKLPPVDQLTGQIKTHFEGNTDRRLYVQVDKPLYKPGETIWIKSWDLAARDLKGTDAFNDIAYELVSPKGTVVLQKRVGQQKGLGHNDFEIPAGAQGGEYIVRALARDGEKGERKIIVSSYEPPRVKKTLEFVRKAYGAGDEVTATIEVKRPTGEPLANHPLRALVNLDGMTLPEVSLTTNADGGGLVRFRLPDQIEIGDGILTVLVDDGGVTESITKRVPIILKKLQLSAFPEGGKLVEGIPGRIYFEAKNMLGKPADVEGRVVDDQGNAVAKFQSYKNGLGRFDFTPSTGRSYHIAIDKPVGVTESYPVPVAESEGCVLRSFDDYDGQAEALRVAVRCSKAQNVVVTAIMRDRLLDAAAVAVPADGQAVVYLASSDPAFAKARGVARVTVFDEALTPVAERVVFQNRRAGLQVKIEADQPGYTPREQAALKVTTTDAAGEPVAAELALSVVDDTVISFADDKKGHMLAQVLLEPEVPGEIEEPNFYFDLKEDKSAQAMDLLMGTRGWRRFDWETVKNPPPPMGTLTGDALGVGGLGLRGVGRGGGGIGEGRIGVGKGAGRGFGAGPRPVRMMEPGAPPPAPAPAAMAAPVAVPEGAPMDALDDAVAAQPMPPPPPAEPPMPDAKPAPPPVMAAERARRAEPMREQAMAQGEAPMAGLELAKDEAFDDAEIGFDKDPDFAGAKKKMAANIADRWSAPLAAVRVFPAPNYPVEYDGPRTDFRETIHWAPEVRTGADGTATVTFNLSDAVTSFRVFAEGAGGGLIGRHEEVIQSSLPFSMAIKLPLEVSQGDVIELPLTLTNERDTALPLSLASDFGDLLKLQKPVALAEPQLAAKARQSLYFPIDVTGVSGESAVKVSANAGGLQDEFVRTVKVEPLGFPQLVEAGGTLASTGATHNVDLSPATAGTVQATLKLYPSPIATMTGGLAGIVRMPSGCFEQTSSSNYPNVMVLRYLQANDVADPALVARTNEYIESGYSRLVGYETEKNGYEWFGSTPPHEALTAYGIVQFLDMKRVYGGVDDAMIARTVKWLESRRDGKGGFQRSAQALDSFGRASPEVTDAYITWAVAEAGLADRFAAEVEAQAKRARESKDAYLLALAANTMLAIPVRADEAAAAVARLAELQGAAGAWTNADHSITRSGGQNLHVETTALALMALMKAGGYEDRVRQGVDWLNANRGGFGEWGATQATVLALEAMTEYAERSRATQGAGTVSVMIDGKVVASQAYAAGHREPIEFTDLGAHLAPGPHAIELRLAGGDRLPYTLAIEYRAENPATAPDATVAIETALGRDTVKMGETVRLNAKVKNVTDQGQPMTLARIGFPGGLTFQTWQLKELRDKKLIAFYETRPREVILYFRDLAPKAELDIPLDLVAMVPGRFTGPASSAYLYYTDDKKHWSPGLQVAVTR